MCARACCSGCFLLAFLTGSWCGVQLRTGKRPFLSTVNHLRERKKMKKREGREKKRGPRPLHWFSPLQSGLLLSLFVFPSLFLSSFPIPYCRFQLFSSSLSFCFCFYWSRVDSSVLEGISEFMESSRVLWEHGEGGGAEERRDEKQMKQGSVGSSAGSSGSVLTYPQQKRSCPRYVLMRKKKKNNIKHLHKLALLKPVLRCSERLWIPLCSLKLVIVWKELKLKTADKPFWVTDKWLNCSNKFPFIAAIPKTGVIESRLYTSSS